MPRESSALPLDLDLDEDELEGIGVPDVVLDTGAAGVRSPGDDLRRRP
jgi:hypothetical protein